MNEASSSTTFPQELADIIESDKVTFYSNNFRVEPEHYNYYQQADHRHIGVPLQCPLMINYQSTGVNNNHNPILQQKPFSPQIKVSDWRCQQVPENPKKRMNNVCDQNVVNKKLAHADTMQGIGCLRERVPVRKSQKLADKITALQKLVSPYGKTDTASVLHEAHISINLLHDQIKKLIQNKQISTMNDKSLEFQDNEEAETSLRDKGLCLVPISSAQINGLDYFMPGNY
ncbi:transcription factor bHLH111-like [Bidens hawaiensis]|uniref:transcription factor bHLH111-like n=1 Tax=Bidens hawaiensis TaxID=980011 RepID=UPI00404ABD14